MRYVLVPVPTEYVLEVMRWVLFRAEDEETRKEDEAKVVEFLAQADLRTRRFLHRVATGTIKGEVLRFRDVADELGEDRAAVLALVDDLNERVLDGHRELLETWAETTIGLEGRQGSMVYIAMRKDLARVVRAAGRPGDG